MLPLFGNLTPTDSSPERYENQRKYDKVPLSHIESMIEHVISNLY